MRRRFVKENRKEVKPVEKPVTKIVAKPIEEKVQIKKEEKKEEIKSVTRKDFATSANVCTNLLPDYTIIGEKSTNYTTLDSETFFRFLFTNVLEYENITKDDTTYQFIPEESNIFNQVNGMELNGNLIASSALYYSTDHYAVGMVIDGIRDAENKLISQVNIKFKGNDEPSTNVLGKEIAWIVATDCCIYPAIAGSKLSDVVNVLDSSKTNYGEHQPINKPNIVHSMSLKSYYPNRKLDVFIPAENSIPTTLREQSENVCGYATGYFFIYNIPTANKDQINDNIRLVLSYVTVPLSFNGTNKIISLGDVVSAAINSQEDATKSHLISVKGNSSNDCGFPRNSSFYQNNFGDSRGNRNVEGDFKILYPAMWWNYYGKNYPSN